MRDFKIAKDGHDMYLKINEKVWCMHPRDINLVASNVEANVTHMVVQDANRIDKWGDTLAVELVKSKAWKGSVGQKRGLPKKPKKKKKKEKRAT
jgi:hypothetical protein